VAPADDRPRRTGAGPDRQGRRALGGRPAQGGRPGQGGRAAAGSPPRPDRDADAPRRPRRVEPELPEDVTGQELDRAVRAELGSLATPNAQEVGRHLVAAGRLLDEDPEAAYAHAVAARDRAGRVAATREAVGIAAYLTGRYAEALAELRAARRMSGDQSHLPLMADCERGLGRPEKALALAASPEVARLEPAARAEMLLVASGARRDLGQPEAAVLVLQGPLLRAGKPWSARLFYGYADALLDAGRRDEALTWFQRAAAADEHEETDAEDRLAELAGDGA